MTVKDFYIMLFGKYDTYDFDMYLGEMLSAIDAEKVLERRTAAYMVHVYLTEVAGEKDEQSIEPAFRIRDIYECSACIRHIAQVYLKGIMPEKDGFFGVRNPVREDEAEHIVESTLNRSKRYWSFYRDHF